MKERCKYELLVEEYFGIKSNWKETDPVHGLSIGDLVDLVCAADQKFNKEAEEKVKSLQNKIQELENDYMKIQTELQTAKFIKDGNDLFECDMCDGVGWYEGGEALKTHCGRCNGTGVIKK